MYAYWYVVYLHWRHIADTILREKANTIANCKTKEELLTIYPENIPVVQKKHKTKVIGFMNDQK